MKQSKICPKCGSDEVIAFMEPTHGINDNGNHIYTGIFSYASLWRYVCCDCGYTEQYVNMPEIKKIREYYKYYDK